MNLPYEYCAYRYLELWERFEKSLYRAISGTHSASQIRDALKYYKIARNFKGLKDDVVAANEKYVCLSPNPDSTDMIAGRK
jgi:hypothetical protein